MRSGLLIQYTAKVRIPPSGGILRRAEIYQRPAADLEIRSNITPHSKFPYKKQEDSMSSCFFFSGVERANIRLWRNSRTLRTSPRTPHCPVHFCVAYHRLATWDIASRKTVINCFSLALRTCLVLGIQSLLITLVVLYARSISSPANIPPLAVCTKTYHIEAPPKVLLFFFLSVVDPYASHETFPIQQIFATCFSKKQPSSNVLTLK